MIDFAFSSLKKNSESSWTIGETTPDHNARYVFHQVMPLLAAMNQSRYRISSVDDMISNGRPFIFSLDLRAEFIIWLVENGVDNFISPHIPLEVLEAARAGTAVIVLSYNEGRPFFMGRGGNGGIVSVYDALHFFMRRHNLPPRSLYFLNSNPGCIGEFSFWLQYRGINPALPLPFEMRFIDQHQCAMKFQHNLHRSGTDYRLSWECDRLGLAQRHKSTNISLAPLANSFDSMYVTPSELASKVDPDKLFLCLNRIIRSHRRHVVCHLQMRGYLDRSLVSFTDKSPNASRFSDVAMQSAWDSLKPRLPLEVDKKDVIDNYDFSTGEAYYDDTGFINAPPGWMFRNTFFSIITETYFWYHTRFSSEKIWKPITNCHPFLILGTPGLIAYLKSLGYRTFSSFIDESYDDISDESQRMAAVLQEIDKIGQLSKADLVNMRHEMKPALDHNYHLLCDNPTVMELVIDEIAELLHIS